MSFKKITEIHKDGAPAYRVFTPDDRIYFLIGRNRVYSHRRYGKVHDSKELSLCLSWAELGDTAQLLAHWEKEREGWAAFERCHTTLPFHNTVWYEYLAPHAKKAVNLGFEPEFQLKGKKEKTIYPVAVLLKKGIYETGEIWHRGESVGNPGGELVGKLFRIRNDITAKLTVPDAWLDRDLTPEEIAAIPEWNRTLGEKSEKGHNWRYTINIETGESEYFPELVRCRPACAKFAEAKLTEHEIRSAIRG